MPGLSATDRLVFRELMDMCWMSDLQDRMRYDGSDVSAKIGLSEIDIEKSIDKISSSDYDLIKFYVDLESDIPESMIRIPYLTGYLDKVAKEEVDERTETFAQKAEVNNTVSIVDRIKQRDSSFEPSILFLERSERALASTFSGWIPTRGFEEKGEAYNVREHIYHSLQKEFGVEPEPVFKDMFQWLLSNPKKRPHLKYVNDFIHRWFSNYRQEKGKSSVSHAVKDQVALDMLSDI